MGCPLAIVSVDMFEQILRGNLESMAPSDAQHLGLPDPTIASAEFRRKLVRALRRQENAPHGTIYPSPDGAVFTRADGLLMYGEGLSLQPDM
jgi:hypothetical protein